MWGPFYTRPRGRPVLLASLPTEGLPATTEGVRRMTLEELAAQLREEYQRAVVEDATVKKAPLLERLIGYLDHVDGVDPLDEYEAPVRAPECARLLGRGIRYVWDHSQEFPFAFKQGREWFYRPSGIERWKKRRSRAA